MNFIFLDFQEKHAEEIEKAQKKATNNKTPKHNNNNNNNNNNDNGHYTVGDENNDDDDDDVVEDVTPVVASPASPDPYQDSTPGARKPGSHRLKGSPKAAAVVVPESEDTSCSSSSSSTSLPDIANNASKVQSPSNDYDQKKSPVRGRKRKTSIQAPDDQPSQQHHQSQQKPKRQQQQQQQQQSDGESNARPKTSEEPVDAAANRSSKRHSIRGRGSAANEPEAAKSTEVKTDEEKPAEAESAEEKPAEPKIAEDKAIEGKSADAISDGASPVTQEGENDSLDAEQAMLQQETEDVVVPMETETNDDAPAEAASTGKNAAANTAAANTASLAGAAGRGARSRRSRPGASLAEPESPATTAPPLPPPPPTKKSRQSRGGSTATEDEEEEQKTEVRNKAETKTKPEPKAGKRGSVAKADETAEDGDAGSGAGTPSDTKTPRTPSAGRGGTKRLSSAERSAVVQQSPSSSASAAEPSSSTSSASTMASLASTAEKLKIPEDVINMPYEQVVGATSPMTCYCHICGKMRYGHLLISQHYERSHNVKLKQDTPIICYVQKAEDFLAKCKWVQLQDLTAEMFPDLVCGVCYLNKSGKKNLFKHLKEKHDIEVDENDPGKQLVGSFLYGLLHLSSSPQHLSYASLLSDAWILSPSSSFATVFILYLHPFTLPFAIFLYSPLSSLFLSVFKLSFICCRIRNPGGEENVGTGHGSRSRQPRGHSRLSTHLDRLRHGSR